MQLNCKLYILLIATVKYGCKFSSSSPCKETTDAMERRVFDLEGTTILTSVRQSDLSHQVIERLRQSFYTSHKLPANFQGKIKTRVGKSNQWDASHELDENEQRQLLFDFESSFNMFMASV